MESCKKLSSEESFKDQVDTVFFEVIKMPEVLEALNLLDGLSEDLVYHNKDHTYDVIRETILFALADSVEMDTIRQQVISAAWHDVGFLVRRDQNESVAKDMFEKSQARKIMTQEQINEVESNILDTQMVFKDGEPHLVMQKSKSGYILDADVSNFGREDFFQKRKLFATELGLDLSDPESKKKFFSFAIALLKNHEWKTESAIRFRQEQKELNLKMMEKEYASIVI